MALGSLASESMIFKMKQVGVPIVAQWLMHSTSIHEYVGSIPDLAQCAGDPAVP